MSKVVLVGLSPGPNTKPGYPMFPYPKTSAAGRLCEVLRMRRSEYVVTFDRVNLWPVWPPPGRVDLRASACNLAATLLNGRRVIALGKDVAGAFVPGLSEWFVVAMHRDTTVMLIPHPSGRNLWYNNSMNVKRVRVKVHAFIGAAKEV